MKLKSSIKLSIVLSALSVALLSAYAEGQHGYPNATGYTVPAMDRPPAVNSKWLREQMTAHRVDSIEKLLSILPKSYLSRYVLAYDSRSVQKATATDPRVILFGPDARFILSFNGDENLEGYPVVEQMEYNAESRSFELSEISFLKDQGNKPIPQAEDEPPLCSHIRKSIPLLESESQEMLEVP